jgi:nicotinate-nucleotide adenylyltransferase
MDPSRPDAGRRIGVLGGTFDPPHLGHLAAASEVHHRLNLDTVLFVPAGRPWHKPDRTPSAPEHRRAMVAAAIAQDPRFALSTVDLDRPGPTYTVDTLADLRAQEPQASFFLLMGADALAGLPSWHRAADVASAASLVGMSRPGHLLAHPGPPAGEVIMIETPGTAVSSSECRLRFRSGVPNTYLVPDSVIAYATAHTLYGGAV